MRLAWITDPHFNHIDNDIWCSFIDRLDACPIDAVLVTGDFSEGEDVTLWLSRLADQINRPIYFVLGNHDFYDRSVSVTRRQTVDLAASHPLLCYLTDTSLVSLEHQVGLVGEDGWGDATVGDFDRSPIRVADFQRIEDFRASDRNAWKQQVIDLGRQSARRLYPKLLAALDRYQTVVVLTHLPPFREACWYLGHTADDDWAPSFVCGQVGKILQQAAASFPNRQVIVLCGHTHHPGKAQIMDNLTVYTGAADYGAVVLSGYVTLADQQCVLEIQDNPFPERDT